MVLGIFSSQNGTESKALARMGVVSYGNKVSIRIVTDSMDARHLAATDVIDAQELLVCRTWSGDERPLQRLPHCPRNARVFPVEEGCRQGPSVTISVI